MAGVNDYLDTVLPPTAASTERKAQAAVRAAPPAPAAPEASPVTHDGQPAPHEFGGVHEVVDSGSGASLAEDTDGSIWLKSVDGKLEKHAPAQAGKLLSDDLSGYSPAALGDVTQHLQDKTWDDASIAAKTGYAARKLITETADGVTALPRLAAKPFISSSTEEKLSGQRLFHEVDSLIEGEQAAGANTARARELEQAAPWLLNTALDVGGMVAGGALGGAAAGAVGKVAQLGGEALGLSESAAAKLAASADALSLSGGGKAAGSGTAAIAEKLGLSAEHAAKLGAYADTVAQGAALGGTQAAHEAWLKDEKLTAEAQWHSVGLGALLGVGGHVALDAMRGLPRAGLSAAEKVFGKPRIAAAMEGEAGAAVAQDMTEGLTSVKQPAGTGGKVQQLLDWGREKIQKAQAAYTGADLEAIKEYGALGPKHEMAEELSKNRNAIFEAGRKDLTSALEDLHTHGETLTEQVANVEMKKSHMARLLADTDHDAILELARDKAVELEQGYAALESTGGSGRSLFGKGKQLEDIKAAYEDAHEALSKAVAPEDVTSALDQFKRATQRAKVNAEQTAQRVTSGIEQNQARARADLMNQVSDKTRLLLQDDKLFGKFGEAQKETNARWNQVLDSDKYIRSQLMENTGRVSQGADFGRARFEIAPQRVESYLNGLGTARAERLDAMLRDNIAARKSLAETLGEHYDLSSTHGAAVTGAKAAADKSLSVLKNLDETLRVTNIVDEIRAKSALASGHGTQGAAVAAMAGHMLAGPLGAIGGVGMKVLGKVLADPMNFTHGVLAMRGAAEKLSQLAERSAGRALGALPKEVSAAPVARVLASKESQERLNRRYVTTATKVAELAQNPQMLVDAVAEHTSKVDHPGVQQALTKTSMDAIGFLASKLPKPLYQDSVTNQNQLKYVSQAERDKFMNYAAAVNAPSDFFKDLANGVASPEQAETAQVMMPSAFAKAQQAAIMQFASGKVKASYQVRLNVQRMLSVQIEPTTNPTLQDFIQAQAQQASQQQQAAQGASGGKAAGRKPAKSAATNLSSSLNNLKV